MNKLRAISFILFIVFAVPVLGQQYPMPATPDTANTGRYIQRTMHLLASSTPEKKNTVKILVYGQSISVQEWWLEVKRDIMERFPNANIIMENKAIGGFSSSLLVKTVEMDVSSFYPDLVLFHVYGDQQNYEAILKTIRAEQLLKLFSKPIITLRKRITAIKWRMRYCRPLLKNMLAKSLIYEARGRNTWMRMVMSHQNY
jgi:hypothetical protein